MIFSNYAVLLHIQGFQRYMGTYMGTQTLRLNNMVKTEQNFIFNNTTIKHIRNRQFGSLAGLALPG
jgi:hypothetical protein